MTYLRIINLIKLQKAIAKKLEDKNLSQEDFAVLKEAEFEVDKLVNFSDILKKRIKNHPENSVITVEQLENLIDTELDGTIFNTNSVEPTDGESVLTERSAFDLIIANKGFNKPEIMRIYDLIEAGLPLSQKDAQFLVKNNASLNKKKYVVYNGITYIKTSGLVNTIELSFDYTPAYFNKFNQFLASKGIV